MSDQPDVVNLLGMARTAALGRNHEEALGYYNRVLEIDPTISEAWLGKGRAAGRLWTPQHLRVAEMLIAFENAIGAAGERRDVVTAEAVSEATAILLALHDGRARRVGDGGAAPAPERHRSVSIAVSDALERVLTWRPEDRATLSAVVTVAARLLKRGVAGPGAAIVRHRFDTAVARLTAMDPGFRAPTLGAPREVPQPTPFRWGRAAIGGVLLFLLVTRCRAWMLYG
jgi:hypothetical protein